ncbi:hypothetical protein TNIN_220651 [Trichonephila inaurata madagascariensis]|uniref:Uncharacterized protein n=1 Tax=Trichonephila inaurata madagascariensis TaxID=2747483 RepID=A0A8X6X0V5_9ARAC|nr:hypothetical protein TNIN_220651 [Trichonephila inaurata madagascariensis]
MRCISALVAEVWRECFFNVVTMERFSKKEKAENHPEVITEGRIAMAKLIPIFKTHWKTPLLHAQVYSKTKSKINIVRRRSVVILCFFRELLKAPSYYNRLANSF